MIRTLAITREHQVSVNVPLTQLDLNDYAWVWADFNQPTEEEKLVCWIHIFIFIH